jgi:hypothetical protein
MNLPPGVTAKDFLEAVRRGVRDAVWEMITSGTDAPGADFYGTVRTTTGSFSNAAGSF